MSPAGAQTVTSSPWAAHRRRGETLRERHPYAREVLALYLALLDAWDGSWRRAREERPPPDRLAAWAAEHALAAVVTATARCGPRPLAAAVQQLHGDTEVEPILDRWLAGDELAPVERYLARAVLRGPLEAVDAAAACAGDPAPRGERRCPRCGGAPQLSLRTNADDSLVTGQRHLACARCGETWPYSGSTCAWCGEESGAKRTVFAERRGGPVVGRGNGPTPTWTKKRRKPPAAPLFPASADRPEPAPDPLLPHLRIEACESCSRYLIDVDLGLDARAVPEVDELTALPLDLFAAERGLTKIAPNLMGF